jgi:hypothetical protein
MDYSKKTSAEHTKGRRLSVSEERALVFLATAGEGATAEGVASDMKIGPPQAELILVCLQEQGLVRCRHAAAVSMRALQYPPKWSLSPAGRKYLAAQPGN